VTYKTCFGVDDCIYWHLIHWTRDYRQLQRYRYFHTSQFTIKHALGFSVFTSRILATDFIRVSLSLQTTTKFSFHSLLPLLSLFCNCQFRRLDSFQFLCSQVISRQVGVSKLDSIQLIFLYNHIARTTRKTQPFYFWLGMFTAPLHSNESYSIVACVFVASGMCLPSRYLATNVYTDFAILAFGHHVTIHKSSRWIPHFVYTFHWHLCHFTVSQ
jgi:hypothetical protein